MTLGSKAGVRKCFHATLNQFRQLRVGVKNYSKHLKAVQPNLTFTKITKNYENYEKLRKLRKIRNYEEQ